MTFKQLLSHTHWLIIFVTFWTLTGCCPDIVHEPDGIYKTLTRNELTTFVDSAGNHEQVYLIGEGMERVYDEWNDCSVDGYAQYPWAEFELLHSGKTMRYDQHEQRVRFDDFSINDLALDAQSVTIQSHEYTNCLIYSLSDSTGHIKSVIIDREYGLIMFSYRNEYRWERILNP